MGRKVKDTGGGSDFKKVPEGTHRAVCNMVVCLDDQTSEWKGQKRIVDQVYIRFELPDERIEYEVDGTKKEGPMSIGKTYTMSLSEKANLRKDLQGWRNKAFTQDELNGFDIESVLGKCCQVVVTHRQTPEKTYANVSSIAGWPKGMDPVQAENELIYYDAENPAAYEKLGNWLKEKIDNAVDRTQGPPSAEDEYLDQTPPDDDDFDDDIPF